VHRDTRTPDNNFIIFCGAGSSNGLYIGNIVNHTPAVAVQGGAGSDIFYQTGVRDYVCQGTPEAMITADIGAQARRTNGGAGTTLYVKESGTGNTGWVAK
jgi:hypothetical protein